MNKIKQNKQQKKRISITIIFVIVWMFYMVLRGIFKLLNYNRIEFNKKIFGNFALIDYWIDVLIFILFIIFIFLFIKKVPKTWKYFIYFITFLISGIVVRNIYNFLLADKIVALLGLNIPPTVFLISTVVSSLVIIVFYSLIIYLVYKNRSYFKNEK